MPISSASTRLSVSAVQRFRFALGLLVLALWLPSAAQAAPPVYTWPGVAPCDTPDPQDCLSGVPDGAAVQLATNDPILWELFVARGVELTAAPGFLPVLSNVYITGSGGIVHGLVIRGFVAIAPGQGMTRAKVAENVVLAAGSWQGIFVRDSDSPGQPPLEVSIENNSVHGAGQCVSLRGLATLGAPSQAIVGTNRLDCENSGVHVVNGRDPQEITIGYNQIQSGFGIVFSDPNPAIVSKPKPVRAAVLGNRVTASYGIAFAVLKDPGGGAVDMEVRENLFTGGDVGVFLSDPTSTLLTGDVSHNVAAFNTTYGIELNGAAQVLVLDNVEFENGP
jgi:hypothetical protein